MRIAPAITLSSEERTRLESQARSRSLPVRVAERARIVLFAASGQQDKGIPTPSVVSGLNVMAGAIRIRNRLLHHKTRADL